MRNTHQRAPLHKHLQRTLAHTQICSLLSSHEPELRGRNLPELVPRQRLCLHGKSITKS
ncbi:hypothetical protein MOTT12_03950 [Mycobacterium intracellulare subsp. yongonense]|nr:hypothetical protein MOTT12_03950 [Mycobacterium intracellulare subsp. yongonense]